MPELRSRQTLTPSFTSAGPLRYCPLCQPRLPPWTYFYPDQPANLGQDVLLLKHISHLYMHNMSKMSGSPILPCRSFWSLVKRLQTISLEFLGTKCLPFYFLQYAERTGGGLWGARPGKSWLHLLAPRSPKGSFLGEHAIPLQRQVLPTHFPTPLSAVDFAPLTTLLHSDQPESSSRPKGRVG